MKELPEIAKRIRRLRKDRGEDQIPFAKRLGVSQASVSSWERGEDTPSPLSCLVLGLFASGADRDWFFKKAGPHLEAMVGASEAILKRRGTAPLEGEIVPIPCVRKIAQGTEETGHLLPLPAECVPNAGSTFCLCVDQETATDNLRSGDLAVFDTFQKGAPDLTPFLEEDVLLGIDFPHKPLADPKHEKWFSEFVSFEKLHKLHGGLRIGRLRCKLAEGFSLAIPGSYSSHWVLTLDAFGASKTESNLAHAGGFFGHWEYVPPKAPSSAEEMVACENEARRRAPSEIRLSEPFYMLGRVIGWFRAPAEKAKE